jgi:peptidoglycan hydrolase CwlO-like protein
MKILAVLFLSGVFLFSVAGVVPLYAQCPGTTRSSFFKPTIEDLQKEYEELAGCLEEVQDTAELADSKTNEVDRLKSRLSEMENRLATAEEELRFANLKIESLERSYSRWEQLVDRARRPVSQPKAAPVNNPKPTVSAPKDQ